MGRKLPHIRNHRWTIWARAAAFAGFSPLLVGALGRWNRVADLANLLVLPATALVLAAIAAMLIARRWKSAAGATLLLLALLTPLITTLWPPRARASAPILTIVSANLWRDNQTPARLTAWLRAQQADVVILAEASGRSRHIPAALADLYPWQSSCTTTGSCSTWILSRVRPTAVYPLARGDSENRRALSALAMQLRIRNETVTIVGVHLARPGGAGRQLRDLAELENMIARLNPASLIIAGDFNATPAMFAMQRFYRATATRPLSGFASSWPTPSAGRYLPIGAPIDQLLVSRDWHVATFAQAPDLGSDHRAFRAALARAN